MFVKTSDGMLYRELIKGQAGSWVISYEAPASPVYVDAGEIESAERIETPGEVINGNDGHSSEAVKVRMELIAPLLQDDAYIMDADLRREKIAQISQVTGVQKRRIARLYFRYLATGTFFKPKRREDNRNPVYDRAIRKHYFTAKKNSLNTAYELMILDEYTDEKGEIVDDAPTFASFKQYYYRHHSKDISAKIARNGLTSYQRNERMIYRSAMNFRDKIGCYQIDETTADIYLVSSYDRSIVIGRPNIYMAIDTATQMIAGAYIGFDAGEDAVMSCIANCAIDKRAYCETMGIEMDAEDWPVAGMPGELISDKGREFAGKRLEELCLRYGVTIMNEPPFRADLKPFVERMMGLISEAYKSMIRGKGIIEADSQERWSIDYRDQAVLTLEEYKKIVIGCIITMNKSRVIDNLGHLPAGSACTALGLWNQFREEGKVNILDVDEREVYVRALPRAMTTVKRTGIQIRNLRYIPDVGETLTVGERVVYAFDKTNVRNIFIFKDEGSFMRCHLSDSSARYGNYDETDIEVIRKEERKDKAAAERMELEYKVRMRERIKAIVDEAVARKAEDAMRYGDAMKGGAS